MSAALALLASLLWGTADFLGGTASRRLPTASVLGVSQLVALLGLLPLALLLGGLAVDGRTALLAVVAGLAGVTALGAFYRALALGTMGVVAPVAALGAAVPVVAGLLAGETPSGLQLAGIAVAVVGVVLASGPELGGSGRGGVQPLLLAVVAAVGFGAVLVLLAEATDGGGAREVVVVLLVMRLVSVLVMAALLVGRAARGGGWRTGVGARDLPVLLVVGAFDVGANGAFAAASQGGLVSVTAVLASLYPVVTVLLARQVHGERLVGPQPAGVGLALVGVVLLAAG